MSSIINKQYGIFSLFFISILKMPESQKQTRLTNEFGFEKPVKIKRKKFYDNLQDYEPDMESN